MTTPGVEPDPSPERATRSTAFARVRKWLTFSNVLFVAVMIWAMPRCWPHVEALVGFQPDTIRRPALSVTTRDGRVVTSDSLRGHVVLVNVWATWCAPCRVEMPALQQIADAYASDSVIVLGLSVDRGPAREVDEFLRERDITYPVAIVDDATINALGGVRGYPTSLLLDRTGAIRHTVLGPIGPITLRPALRRLIAEPNEP